MFNGGNGERLLILALVKQCPIRVWMNKSKQFNKLNWKKYVEDVKEKYHKDKDK